MQKCEKTAAVTGIPCAGCRQASRKSVSARRMTGRCFAPRGGALYGLIS